MDTSVYTPHRIDFFVISYLEVVAEENYSLVQAIRVLDSDYPCCLLSPIISLIFTPLKPASLQCLVNDASSLDSLVRALRCERVFVCYLPLPHLRSGRYYHLQGAAFAGPHHRWRRIVLTELDLEHPRNSGSMIIDCFVQDAVESLNSLQTPFAILEERRRLGLKLGGSAVDEMREWIGRAGHKVPS